MEAAGAAATIAQLISFTGQVLVAGYSFISKVQRAPSEISALLRETANLNALLDQLQSLVDSTRVSPSLTEKNDQENALLALQRLGVFGDCERLMKVVQSSVKACEQIEKQQVRNLGKRIMWPFKEKETKDTMVQLGRLRETLSAAVVVDSAKTLRALEETARTIDNHVISALVAIMDTREITMGAAEDIALVKQTLQTSMGEEEMLKVRRWLYPDGIDTEASFVSAQSLKHPMTGDWLVHSRIFESWLISELGCMWIYGIAGSGKTVLTSTIVHHLKQTAASEFAIIYFFCDHRDPNMQNFRNLLHVVCKQLLEQNPDGIEEVRSWYRDRTTSKSTEVRHLFDKEYIELIHRLCMKWKRVYLAVDALDECTDTISFVEGLTKLAARSELKMALTSRHEVELERLIRPITGFPVDVKSHMSADIQSFVFDEVKRRRLSGSLKCRDESLEVSICVAILQNSSEMILIARLQLDYICRLKSERAIKEALSTLPSTVYQIYDDILSNLVQKNPDDVEDIGRILRWLVGSKIPLTLNELAEAISIRAEDRCLDRSGISTDVLDLAACCGALVTVHNQDSLLGGPGTVRISRRTLITLSHASVEEYLKSGKMRTDLANLFPMGETLIHRELMKICLQYIGFEDFMVPIRLSIAQEAAKRRPFEVSRSLSLWGLLGKRKSTYALLNYAAVHWTYHFNLSSIVLPLDTDTKQLLSWFINWEQKKGTYVSWQQSYHHNPEVYPDQPPLFYAIEFELDTLATLLLPPKEEVDFVHADETAIHVAAKHGALKIAKQLLDLGASLELGRDADISRGLTPLHNAAEEGDVEMIKLLLDHGASIHARSDSETTPFYRAARSGSVPSMQVLYEAGSDINALTWDNFYPLIEALENGRAQAAEQLLEWGADPTPKIGVEFEISALGMLTQVFKTSKEAEIWSEIQKRRQRGPGAFEGYLKGLKPITDW